MGLPDKIEYTPNGGHYYKAVSWLYFTVAILLIPIIVLLIIGLLNPFWFRDSYLLWLQNSIERLTAKRNYKMYSIYLGMDPKVWHALKNS